MGEAAVGVEVTWWGHATLTLVDSGHRVLTDPVFVDRLAHLYRRGGGAVPRAAYAADLVLVSHAHADHLHIGSLRRVHPAATVLVPHGLGPAVRHRVARLDVREVAVGDVVRHGDLEVRVVEAQHRGARGPWSTWEAEAVGYVVRGSATTYFPGDTALFDGMTAIGSLGIDLALLPVGGWAPTPLRGGHLDPVAAAEAVALLRPRVVLPIHYGTFWPLGLAGFRDALFRKPGSLFAKFAAERAPDVVTHVPHPGQTVRV